MICRLAVHSPSRRALGIAIAANNTQHYVVVDNNIPLCHHTLVYRARPIFRVKAQPETITPERQKS